MRTLLIIVAFVGIIHVKTAEAAPQIPDPKLRAAVEALSASTLVDGKGWKAYDQLVHPGYSRWAMGQIYEGREKFIRSLEEWWNYGMRVANRDIEMIGVDVVGNLAFIRFKTTESFTGPNGPTEGFTGYVTNVWIKENDNWLLLSAEISSTK